MQPLPAPHGDKLTALLANPKLPTCDVPRVQEAIARYQQWREAMHLVNSADKPAIDKIVALLNAYKQFVEVDLIFDSEDDFLYRQKGQLKLDNTILEEFLPLFVTAALQPYLEGYALVVGPLTCFSSLRFESSLTDAQIGGGMQLREKAHDFAIGRAVHIRAAYSPDFADSAVAETNLAYIAAECKTNLDKTMFQEAAATALDLKIAVPGARYFLLCEWLDMSPISTHTTAIDEIIILRKAKRLPANIRAHFNTVAGRKANRDILLQYLETHPLAVDTFVRFLEHIQRLFSINEEAQVLERGYF